MDLKNILGILTLFDCSSKKTTYQYFEIRMFMSFTNMNSEFDARNRI